MRRIFLVVTTTLLLGGCGDGGDPRPGTRAYAGAPPTIPHQVESLGRGNCLGCHGAGLEVSLDGDKQRGPETPHPNQLSCRQCHVVSSGESVAFGHTIFQGALPGKGGNRSHPIAPPLIPHPLQNRKECLSCHGDLGDLKAPTSSHQDRLSCSQCHIPLNPELGAWLPPK